jgi:hypothetical protein
MEAKAAGMPEAFRIADPGHLCFHKIAQLNVSRALREDEETTFVPASRGA